MSTASDLASYSRGNPSARRTTSRARIPGHIWQSAIGGLWKSGQRHGPRNVARRPDQLRCKSFPARRLRCARDERILRPWGVSVEKARWVTKNPLVPPARLCRYLTCDCCQESVFLPSKVAVERSVPVATSSDQKSVVPMNSLMPIADGLSVQTHVVG